MFETIRLSQKVDKEQYKKAMPELEAKLGELQRQAKDLKIPILVLFEGWDAAGKGTLINELLLCLDPRGFNVQITLPPNEEERLRPFLWRFWTRTPEKGRIAIFDRSWYRRVLVERVDGLVKKSVWASAYDEIESFERQLTDDGLVLIKFFLHISQKEQKKRLTRLASNPATAWKVTEDDWRRHKQYDEYLQAAGEMIAKTHTESAPWTIVESHDRRFATLKVFETFAQTVQARIDAMKSAAARPAPPRPAAPAEAPSFSILNRVDLSPALDREQYGKTLKECQAKIRDLEYKSYKKRLPVLIVYEGWDAAGKGGNIKRLAQGMDPRGYEVIPIAAPSDEEKAHHYLWRFWKKIPKAGHIAIFDRSWYGRVMVERVEGFCTEEEWKRAYREINEMESQLVSFGAALIKFWLQIGNDEQLQRFQARQADPNKQWKITPDDWRNREKWPQYNAAVEEMLYRTSTTYAPWTIVEANDKLYARIKALQTVIHAMETRLK
ncbi:MAG: phosphate--AMP phosphotransferase [Candidatus Sumerlaeota bacterium]|nr:phosphate--AMP phosphotransferase [Candidatus Sumerlaeota bacterium]